MVVACCDTMDHSLPGSSVHGIFQARILKWVAMPSSRGSSWPIAGRYFTAFDGTNSFQSFLPNMRIILFFGTIFPSCLVSHQHVLWGHFLQWIIMWQKHINLEVWKIIRGVNIIKIISWKIWKHTCYIYIYIFLCKYVIYCISKQDGLQVVERSFFIIHKPNIQTILTLLTAFPH